MSGFQIIEQVIAGILNLTDGYYLIPTVGIGGAIEALEKVDVGQVISYSLVFLFMMAFLVGVGLALTAKKFAVKIDPVVEKVRDVLPGANCGACGYGGCQGYAEAVATMPDVPPNLCAPGKTSVAEVIAELTGKVAEKVEPKVARVFCQGGTAHTTKRYVYNGIKDCRAALLAGGGDKSCIYGCLGYGTCAVVCPFDAITMTEDNLPEVDLIKCTACGKCAIACPKKIIEILPLSKQVIVRCYSKDKGSVVKKYCHVGCIACGICVKTCPFEAIAIENNFARSLLFEAKKFILSA